MMGTILRAPVRTAGVRVVSAAVVRLLQKGLDMKTHEPRRTLRLRLHGALTGY